MNMPDNKTGEKKNNKALAGVMNAAGTVIIIVVLLFCLSLSIQKAFGITPYVIVSGSMSPEITTGSLVYAKQCDPGKLKEKDIIVFLKDGPDTAPVTHRIVGIKKDEKQFITRGDANEKEDISPVDFKDVQGRVVAVIPRAGRAAALMDMWTGKCAVILITAAGLLLIYAGKRIRRENG